MFALFVSLSSDFPDLADNPGVYLFETKDEALAYAIKTLVEAGEYAEPDESDADALEGWQDGLGASEYFHVYPVRRRCPGGLAGWPWRV